MEREIVRFKFREPSERCVVEDDICLAIFVAECLYGQPRVRLEVGYVVNENGSGCVLEVRGPAGEATACIFTGLSTARVGDAALHVERVIPTAVPNLFIEQDP